MSVKTTSTLRRARFENMQTGVPKLLRDGISHEPLVLDDEHDSWRVGWTHALFLAEIV